VPAATAAGFASVHALPLRLRENILGTLGQFGTRVGSLGEDDLNLGTALAHVASVAIVQNKAFADKGLIAETALDSRGILKQAKGLLAQQGDLNMAELSLPSGATPETTSTSWNTQAQEHAPPAPTVVHGSASTFR
jgi:hypothetical protein